MNVFDNIIKQNIILIVLLNYRSAASFCQCWQPKICLRYVETPQDIRCGAFFSTQIHVIQHFITSVSICKNLPVVHRCFSVIRWALALVDSKRPKIKKNPKQIPIRLSRISFKQNNLSLVATQKLSFEIIYIYLYQFHHIAFSLIPMRSLMLLVWHCHYLTLPLLRFTIAITTHYHAYGTR